MIEKDSANQLLIKAGSNGLEEILFQSNVVELINETMSSKNIHIEEKILSRLPGLDETDERM